MTTITKKEWIINNTVYIKTTVQHEGWHETTFKKRDNK